MQLSPAVPLKVHLPECLCLQVLQETTCVEHAGSQLGGASSMPCDKETSDDIVIGPMPHAHTPPTGDKQTRAAQVQAAFLCGVINGIITIPVMTSFAAIIFQASRSHHSKTSACLQHRRVLLVTVGTSVSIALGPPSQPRHTHLPARDTQHLGHYPECGPGQVLASPSIHAHASF